MRDRGETTRLDLERAWLETREMEIEKGKEGYIV